MYARLRRNMHRTRAATVALAGLVASVTQAAEPGPDAWQFELTPYLFGAGLDGKTGIGGVTADVGVSFGDILNNLDSGFMAMFEARKGPWSLGVDGVYLRLAGQQTKTWEGPAGIGSATGVLDASMTDQVYQLAAGYRLVDANTKLDVIGAARYTQLDTNLDLVVTTGGLLPGGSRRVDASESWWDPVVGIRVVAPFAEHWAFVGYADIGGFGVGSDATYQAIIGINWQFAKSFIGKFGYRYFYQDYKHDSFVWDMAAHGLSLGLGIRF